MAIDVNELLAPIPGDDPAGSDASFSDQFDRIREARRSDDATLAQGDWQTELKVSDWRQAQSLAEEILLRTSKDLQAAVWLGEAVISRFGLEGAKDSFDLLAGMLDTYWEGMFPRADDGDLEERAGKLAWFATYGTRALQMMMLNNDPQAPLSLVQWIDSREVDNLGRQNASAYQSALDEGRIGGDVFDSRIAALDDGLIRERLEQLAAARDAFTRFSSLSDGKLGRDAPNLAPIDDALKKVQQIFAKVATAKGLGGVALSMDDTSDPSPDAGNGAAVASGSTGGGVALELGSDSLASKDAALRAISDIAAFFRRTEPHNPVAYLLDRAVVWANMPLEDWLAEVIRDQSTLSSIRERVGLSPSN